MSFEGGREARFGRAEGVLAEYFAQVDAPTSVTFERWCESHDDIADELRALFAECVRFGPGMAAVRSPVTVDSLTDSGNGGSSCLYAQIATRPNRFEEYDLQSEIGRGGMGRIVAIRDRVLRRDLAMKVIRSGGPTTGVHRLERFLAEAQITSQLDHPGVVPVHELGVDPNGQAYFTMKRVEGCEFGAILARMRSGADDSWTMHKALNVLLRVCEAVAYAHSRGVIHRDLKPANIMVGAFGEVYVMDWGLAKLTSGAGNRDDGAASVATHRSGSDGHKSNSALATADGQVFGTAAYMSPEQALGDTQRVDRRTDVYAIGAILYELLAGHEPYLLSGEAPSPADICDAVIAGPPASLRTEAPHVAQDLVAIAEKAMSREITDRYASVGALKSDLEAWLERRVVHAYESGIWAEIRKWAARNRFVASLVLVSLVVVGTLFGLYVSKQAALISKQEENASLRAQADSIERDKKELDALKSEVAGLWPAVPNKIPALEAWLARARALLQKLPSYESSTAAKSSLQPTTTDKAGPIAAASQLATGLQKLQNAMSGPMSGTQTSAGWSIERRLVFARSIETRSVIGPDAAIAWTEAQRSLRDAVECPKYGGLRIEPQVGLLPIGRDPHSGLWEFAHLASGDPAHRDAHGNLVLEPTTGLVLVLIPGGECWIGAQSTNPQGPNFDSLASSNEGPPELVRFDAFFMSKFEVTQEQWYSITQKAPSHYHGDKDFPSSGALLGLALNFSPRNHPVEGVSWEDCQDVLTRLGLSFPTEAQWEYAARAGGNTAWPGTAVESGLEGLGNLFDESVAMAMKLAPADYTIPSGWFSPVPWSDGHPLHSPVGTFAANAFGLHDVIGNVFEWCLEDYGPYRQPARSGDGLRKVRSGKSHSIRGGCFIVPAGFARAAFRFPIGEQVNIDLVGLRPALRLAASKDH